MVDNSNGCLVELDRKIRKVESQAGDTGSKWSQFKRSRLMVGSKYVYKEGAIVGMTNRLDRCRSMMQIILAGISRFESLFPLSLFVAIGALHVSLFGSQRLVMMLMSSCTKGLMNYA